MPYAHTVIILAVAALVYRLLQVGKRDPRMPKGPPTLPIIGNAHQIPATGLYKQFREWAKQYGPVFSLTVGPSNIIVLCNRRAIHKLLLDEKHFRVQEAEATVLMTNLLNHPGSFYQDIRRYTASVVTSITYGFRAATFDSFWGHWTAVMEPGASPPVEVFIILKYAPAWMALWKRRAINAGVTMDQTWSEARRRAEGRRARGDRRPCIIDALLDEYEKKGMPTAVSQHAFTNLLGEMVEGGADTTAAQLLTLILAFALHPHVQEKARREIDAVCGTERSPLRSDFPRLPYINCIVKEGMRWRPVYVCYFPDDEYDGMLIPKDSTIFIPTWAIHHMDTIYEDPDTFDPDRYLQHDKLANDYAGSPDWAKRDKSSLSKLLWAFEFAEPVDLATGKVVHLDPEAYNPGILQAPLPFNVQIKIRSDAHAETIKREHHEALGFLKQYE
ncbi:cytochrome P450 [Zopfia rhizophila CBS 207.26]|uniref:Cytochrome P450 n=1 Tax=Zopfia rhizophila CBS 207.26 TaxID=1314779 RepID=A0A6A6DII5_9PEZI|nr:cytochrome P450 [Zopfia rhizophila CBS 207.26]